MARIVVTGGAGFIGSFTVRQLELSGYEVCVFDNLSLGHRNALGSKTKFYHVDLCNKNLLRDTLKEVQCDGVIHFAALTQVGESRRRPSHYWDNNLAGTKNLLDAMREANVSKIVVSGTAATYGEPQFDLKTGITEDFPKAPINVYGQTKVAMENLLEGYSAAYGFRALALRYFNACGASEDGSLGEDHTPESHLIPLVVAAGLGIVDAQKGFAGKIVVAGDDYPTPDGTCIRDYIDVRDLAVAHVLAFEHLERLSDGSKIEMNVGTGRGYSVREVISAANEILAPSGKSVPEVSGARRAGDPPALVANSQLLQKTVGWQPRFNLFDSIAAVHEFMKRFPLGYEKKV